jgi:RNA polymerase sigma factor (sigma-70 family)
MLAGRLLVLTALAGWMVVVAAATDDWDTARRGFVRLLGRGDAEQTGLTERRLEETRQQLIGAVPSAGSIRTTLAGQWADRLAELLEENPDAETELRALIREIQAVPHAEVRSASSHAASANGVASTSAAAEPAPEHPGSLAARSELADSIGLAGGRAAARDQFAAPTPVAERVPYRVGMDDHEVVATIAAGDAAGIAATYDKYAADLYGYCQWMLRQPTDAAEALRDTFITAAAVPGDLLEAPGLRPWLYSVARQECKRRLKATWAADGDAGPAGQPASAGQQDAAAGQATDETQPIPVVRERANPADQPTDETIQFRAVDQPADPADQPTDETIQFRAVDQPANPADGLTGVSGASERAELRTQIRAVLAELKPRAREVAELTLWHGLHDADLAIALGVSRRRAHTLTARARGQVEEALGALLIARTGREACPELDALLADNNKCEMCAARTLGALRLAAIPGLLPLPELPPWLREQILAICDSTTPTGVADHRRRVRRVESVRSARFSTAIVIVLCVLLVVAASRYVVIPLVGALFKLL